MKTVTTETRPVQVRVPRDREGTFEPQLVQKRQTRLEGFDETVLALYGRGMSTRDIQVHLHEPCAASNRSKEGDSFAGSEEPVCRAR